MLLLGEIPLKSKLKGIRNDNNQRFNHKDKNKAKR
ncbi:hypothetical protein CUP0934 [Campylobacter upsaliensis RM3195]|nr:hypothetical protein CUP0934 [Campylobacter upsaliensis RM3195]